LLKGLLAPKYFSVIKNSKFAEFVGHKIIFTKTFNDAKGLEDLVNALKKTFLGIRFPASYIEHTVTAYVGYNIQTSKFYSMERKHKASEDLLCNLRKGANNCCF